MSQHKVMVTSNVIRNDKRKYFFKTARTSTAESMSLGDILDRDYRKFPQGLKNCLHSIKTQKYKRIIYFLRSYFKPSRSELNSHFSY